MNKYIPERVNALSEYNPDLTPVKIKLDANENPRNKMSSMRDEIVCELSKLQLNRYPDPNSTELLNAFCDAYDIISTDYVVAGNGSDELISIIVSTFSEYGDSILVTSPDFSMYEFYSEFTGRNVIEYKKNEIYDIDFDELEKSVKDNNVKIVFISNPCNPTGKAYSFEALKKFVLECGALVIVDEAYMEFADSETYSFLRNASAFENVIVLKTLSKAFGLAALRLGFAVADKDLIKALKKTKSPYNVNSLSQAIGVIALKHSDEVFSEAKAIARETLRLSDSLKDIVGDELKIFETSANFIMAECKSAEKAGIIAQILKNESINIRLLNKKYLRITCGTSSENNELLCVFERIFKNEKN